MRLQVARVLEHARRELLLLLLLHLLHVALRVLGHLLLLLVEHLRVLSQVVVLGEQVRARDRAMYVVHHFEQLGRLARAKINSYLHLTLELFVLGDDDLQVLLGLLLAAVAVVTVFLAGVRKF